MEWASQAQTPKGPRGVPAIPGAAGTPPTAGAESSGSGARGLTGRPGAALPPGAPGGALPTCPSRWGPGGPAVASPPPSSGSCPEGVPVPLPSVTGTRGHVWGAPDRSGQSPLRTVKPSRRCDPFSRQSHRRPQGSRRGLRARGAASLRGRPIWTHGGGRALLPSGQASGRDGGPQPGLCGSGKGPGESQAQGHPLGTGDTRQNKPPADVGFIPHAALGPTTRRGRRGGRLPGCQPRRGEGGSPWPGAPAPRPRVGGAGSRSECERREL